MVIYFVKEYREKARISQRELSRKAMVSHTMIGLIERGERDATVETICRIADALRVNPAELYKYIK